MNIEEAVKELTEIKELVEEDLKYKDYNVTAVLDQIDLESLVVVLNELDKKDQVIDMMAECIDGEPTFGYGHLRDINTPEKVKEYFYKKIEKIN